MTIWNFVGKVVSLLFNILSRSSTITSWKIDGDTLEAVTDFIFLGSKITADGDYEIKGHLLLAGKAMINLDSILKSRDVSLLTKVRLVKAMVLPVVITDVSVGP